MRGVVIARYVGTRAAAEAIRAKATVELIIAAATSEHVEYCCFVV